MGAETKTWWLPLQVVAKSHCAVLALSANVEDQGLDLRRNPVGTDPGPAGAILQPFDPTLPVPAEPDVELRS